MAAGSYQFEVNTDSAAKPTTNTWTVSSDERIKEEITLADLDICYNTVKNLPLKRFKWKYYDTATAPDQHMLGYIAQDVQIVFPKAVQAHEFETVPEIKELVSEAVVDEEGNILVEAVYNVIQERQVISDCLNLNGDQINKVLYGAVQKMQGIIEDLTNRILILEGV